MCQFAFGIYQHCGYQNSQTSKIKVFPKIKKNKKNADDGIRNGVFFFLKIPRAHFLTHTNLLLDVFCPCLYSNLRYIYIYIIIILEYYKTQRMKVTRVYWPLDVLRLERKSDYPPSIVVGWRNSETDLVVVTTLPYVDPIVADGVLKRDVLLTGAKNPGNIYQLCGQKRMSVLGTLNCADHHHNQHHHQSSYSNLPIKATMDKNMKYPEQYHKYHKSIMTILFDLPRPYSMQFYSIDPISLELSESASTVISEEYESSLVQAKLQQEELIEKIKLHSLHNTNALKDNQYLLTNCISQINCSHELGTLMRKNASIVFPKLKQHSSRRTSFGESVLESAKSVNSSILNVVDGCTSRFISPLIHQFCITVLMVGRIFAEGILKILEWRAKPNWYALKDISATAQQIDLRLQQYCFWPVQYMTLMKRSRDWSSNTKFNVEYIRFYNSIWLVVNDVILGVAMGRLILDNADYIIDCLSYFVDMVLTEMFKNNTLWLMDWPGGLKLNNELAAFFGELFLWVIQFWNMSLNLFRPYFKLIVSIVGYSSFVGATYSISMISDFISLLTLHVYSFYIASARIYHWQLVVLESLFHLFRGKKHNVLRKRIDRCNYELDQLLMGTILFTVLIFLLPTVLVFYLTFTTTRVAIVLTCSTLETCLTFLNHFPIFTILLRLKDSKRLPGGIKMEIVSNARTDMDTDTWSSLSRTDTPSPTTNSTSNSFVMLKPVPLKFSHMFHQYHILSSRLLMHYVSLEVIRRLLTGQFVPMQRAKLYGLLYSMLPEQRIKIQPLYQQLREL